MGIGQETLHSLIVDVCTALGEQGLPRVVLVDSHAAPEQLATLRRAVHTVALRSGQHIGHLDLACHPAARRLPAQLRAGQCHGGRCETSLVLAERPELVDTAQLRDVAACDGSPFEATGAEGESTFDTLTAMLVEVIRELV